MAWHPRLFVLRGALLILTLLLAGCAPGGDNGQPTAPATVSVQTEQQAIANLLTLYQEAVEAEDNDRLAALLAPPAARAQGESPTAAPAVRQESSGAVTVLSAWQETLRPG